jgi:hypothetical protein
VDGGSRVRSAARLLRRGIRRAGDWSSIASRRPDQGSSPPVQALRRLYRLAEPPLDSPAWRAWLALDPQRAIEQAIRNGAMTAIACPPARIQSAFGWRSNMHERPDTPIAQHSRLIGALCEDLATALSVAVVKRRGPCVVRGRTGPAPIEQPMIARVTHGLQAEWQPRTLRLLPDGDDRMATVNFVNFTRRQWPACNQYFR